MMAAFFKDASVDLVKRKEFLYYVLFELKNKINQ